MQTCAPSFCIAWELPRLNAEMDVVDDGVAQDVLCVKCFVPSFRDILSFRCLSQ